MTTVATPTLGSFSAVDTNSGAATLVAALDEQSSIPATIQRLRVAATEPGESVASSRPTHSRLERSNQ